MPVSLDKPIGEALIQVLLSDSSDREKAIGRLINLISKQDGKLATNLQEFVSKGVIGPSYLHLSDTRRSLVLEQYFAIRTLPQSLGVQFAIECTERAFHYYESQYPEERRPRRLLGLIQAWLKKAATKRAIRQLAQEVDDFATTIDSQLDHLFSTGQMDSWGKNERESAYLPLRVLQLLLATSLGVTLRYPQYGRSLERVVDLSIEIESLGQPQKRLKVARNWQLQCLTKIIASAVGAKDSDAPIRRTRP